MHLSHMYIYARSFLSLLLTNKLDLSFLTQYTADCIRSCAPELLCFIPSDIRVQDGKCVILHMYILHTR